ncbi:hypothetical protein E2562_032678 [Oryza meyeriana var. granulata]|uniref:Uncharacterized protein n=1 Tax=Oryza meyeriana var. granulata TaxID=110450 RepID=A0A6G1FF29_9ORYZ|nr:hypothetical protein E2562_032678 [Oryza meyeriana var. granulata]
MPTAWKMHQISRHPMATGHRQPSGDKGTKKKKGERKGGKELREMWPTVAAAAKGLARRGLER